MLEYITNLENPVILDKNNQFIYFPINKNAQTSICRNLLKDRCILKKDNKLIWQQKFDNLSNIDNYYKFGVIRNPYDKFVSAYFYLLKCNKLPHHLDLTDFVLNHFGDFYDGHFQKQKPQLYYNDILMVDKLIRFENLSNDWEDVKKNIGCGDLKKHNMTNHKSYKELFNADTRPIINTYYKEDLEIFDYEY